MKPYKVLCNSLLKRKESRRFPTGGRALLWANVAASTNENHFLSLSDLLVLDLQQDSFPTFPFVRALLFAKGDSLDCIGKEKEKSTSYTEFSESNIIQAKNGALDNLGNHQLP